MRLKIEINSREHFSVLDLVERRHQVRSRWFSGSTVVRTYELEELLGTKLRALYQRKKSRDLFDLWTSHRVAKVDPERVVSCFLRYLDHDGLRVSRAEFEQNLAAKLGDEMFTRDIEPLLVPGAAWDLDEAACYAREELLARLPGDPWRGGAPRPI
jgi:predicted nucleotidyltransferase component of viral defense system